MAKPKLGAVVAAALLATSSLQLCHALGNSAGRPSSSVERPHSRGSVTSPRDRFRRMAATSDVTVSRDVFEQQVGLSALQDEIGQRGLEDRTAAAVVDAPVER